MARHRRRAPTKKECNDKLAWIYEGLRHVSTIVKAKRLKPRVLYDELDRMIGQLSEVQMTLIIRSHIRPKKKEKAIPAPDMWWPKYWRLVRELETKGIDPKSAEAGPLLEELQGDTFN